MAGVRVQCRYCGSTWHIEMDHVRAASKGGVMTVPSCRACNRTKRDKTSSEWLDYLKANDRYRWRRIVRFQKRKRPRFAQMVRRQI